MGPRNPFIKIKNLMIILRNKTYSTTKKILGYGAGVAIGSGGGEYVGKKIGTRFKKPLKEKELRRQRDQLKSREDLIKYLNNNDISEKNDDTLWEFFDNGEVEHLLDKYGSSDNPDEYDYNRLNKNKHKIIKEVQGYIDKNKKILANPEKHPGDYSKVGGIIGSTVGVAGGLAAAHKLINQKK